MALNQAVGVVVVYRTKILVFTGSKKGNYSSSFNF